MFALLRSVGRQASAGTARPRPGASTLAVMKRIVVALAGGYILLAVLGHVKERSGAVRCTCTEECWCKKPGISLFRWVFPFGHSLD